MHQRVCVRVHWPSSRSDFVFSRHFLFRNPRGEACSVKERRRGKKKESPGNSDLNGDVHWNAFQTASACACCVTVFRWEGGDWLDCNLRLCPSQNNSSNNLAFPLRSALMSALHRTRTLNCAPARVQWFRRDGGKNREEIKGWEEKWQTPSVLQMVFRCSVLTSIVVCLPRVRSSPLLLHCTCDGWPALSYE